MYQSTPILSVSGPRQAGKTSFIQEMRPDFDYITFEDSDIRQLLASQKTAHSFLPTTFAPQ